MSTLESQYWKFLEDNPGSTITFDEWNIKLGEQIQKGIDKTEEIKDNYSPYCPVCSGCGEDGCCSASICKMDPDGSFCSTYYRDLKFGYKMDKWFHNNIYEKLDETLKKEYDEMWDKTYDEIYR
jgi:hypothetical protein